MSKKLLITLLLLFSQAGIAQELVYDFMNYQKTTKIPEGLNSERSVVLFSVPSERKQFTEVGAYEEMINQAHRAFVTMGIDAVLYLNQLDYLASKKSMDAYQVLFDQRRVEHVIFLTKHVDSYEILISPIAKNSFLIEHDAKVFYLKDTDLYSLLLRLGREVRRAGQEVSNFLIPEKPNYLEGISIVEKSLLKNYPSILRRSKLAVERFSPFEIPQGTDSLSAFKIRQHNMAISRKNRELEEIIKSYPYAYEMVEPMSDEELIRKRFQYVLRSISGKAESVRRMLDYNVLPSETGFVSLLPSEEKTKTKMIPKNALVHKFYIKQNVSKNVHAGEWDADISWQAALQNLIGNLSNDLKN